MKRFALALLLALIASIATAADYTQYIGPDGKPVPAGKYWRIVTHDDGRPPTVDLILDTGTTVTPPPPPVDPPPVVDVAAKVDALLAAVNDPTKAATARGVAEGYNQILLLVSSGLLRTPDNVRLTSQIAIETGLRKANKLDSWQSFVDGMDTLTAPMDLPAIVDTYKIAKAKLGGTPQPDPPPPAPGVTMVTYVYEKDQTPMPPEVSAELQRLNADGESSVVASEFEEDTVNGLGQTPTQYVTALAEARKVGLPAVVIQGADGTLKAIRNPTAAEITEALK